MKKYYVLALALIFVSLFSQAQEYKIVTTVESIVPMGAGRSRIIDHNEQKDLSTNTEHHNEAGSVGDMGKRKSLKVTTYDESKLLNFYSGVGINFQNIASNDALISAKINDMIKEGWQLIFVTSAVESDAGKGDGNGIFITRFIFKK